MGRRCVLEIQDSCLITGSTYNVDIYHQNFNCEPSAFDHGHCQLAGSVPIGDSNNDRQSEMAAETGNSYISETMWSTVKIPTTNLRFKTMYRWNIVLASEYNSDWQPEISIWPLKPEVIIYAELWQIASKFQHQIRDFRWWRARYKVSQMIATTIDYQKIARLAPRTSILTGFRSLSQSPGVSFFALGVVENRRFAVGIVILSVIVPDIRDYVVCLFN